MSSHFMSPGRLWLLVAVAAMAAVYVALQLRRPRYAVRFSSMEMLDKVAPRRPGWRRHVVAGAFLAGLAGLVVSVAQPLATERVPRERSTIVLAIDTSLSMKATDVAPTRLQAAQKAAKQFVADLPPKINVALIGFAGTAQLMVPPTQDRATVTRAIDGLHLQEATAIGDAVKLSVEVIKDQVRDTKNGKPDATVVLLSDGETTVGLPTADSVPIARKAKVAINTIAYGTPDGEITVDPNGDGSAQTAKVPVNTAELAALAEQTGGLSRTAESLGDLQQVYKDFGSSIGFDKKETDVGWRWAAGSLAVLMLGGALSLWWLQRLP